MPARAPPGGGFARSRAMGFRVQVDRGTRGGDGLPEHMRFPDEGCDLYPRCLSCRLPRCKYDDPAAARRGLMLARDEETRPLRQTDGLSIPALAHRYGLSRRSIFRILRGTEAPTDIAAGPSHDA